MKRDVLRRVALGWTGYVLVTYSTGQTDRRGASVIGYELTSPAGAMVFHGEDFCASPLHADDSDETLRGILGFLTLRPGDTDREHFATYTPEQWAFAHGDAETCQLWTLDEPFTDLDV
jgi:hypothetical protein